MRIFLRGGWLAGALLAILAPGARGTDLVTLSPQTWDAYAPTGKEADAIYGDIVLRNDRVVAVIARPVRMRNANMMVRDVGGMIIDLARRDGGGGDQLQVLFAASPTNDFQFAGVEVDQPEIFDVERNEADGTNQARPSMFVRAGSITLKLLSKPRPDRPLVELRYTLADDADAITIETTWTNDTGRDLTVDPADVLRAERTFEKAADGRTPLFWAEDRHFGQAYGVQPGEAEASGSVARLALDAETRGHLSTLRYVLDEQDDVALKPGDRLSVSRRFFPAGDLFGLKAAAIGGDRLTPASLTVRDTSGAPVAGADVTLELDGELFGRGRTDAEGRLTARVPDNGSDYRVEVVAPWGDRTGELTEQGPGRYAATLPRPGRVAASITSEQGGPIPCKVQFVGKDGTPTPDFGPDTGTHAVGNLYYSHDGAFSVPLLPGSYDVIVSYGPEYDAVFTELAVDRGEETTLAATLERSVDTTGWVSSDFHSHSTPSGDNSSSQLGRVLNLLCEHVEFAPCTEHNRLSTYVPHLRSLGAEHLMATCTGIELTSIPGDVNHQNAFPLVLREHVQDGGGPMRDLDPEMQIERLALWDGYSDKLIQLNHPDLGHVFFDRNGDGEPDQGFRGMFGHIDVIEVHPPHFIFEPARIERNGRSYNNTIVNWMQMINQGHRFPGVVNTDAHYNLHGSGWLRNYLKSPTDDPREIDVADMVRAAESGQVIMTNGPFLDVAIRSNGAEAIPGGDLEVPGGSATLRVRVQCPNWFDVDRVQVFLNGRASGALNYTRADTPDAFGDDGPVAFDREIPLTIEADTHVIVATVGERSTLGAVFGEGGHADDRPIAVSNPIFLDLGGDGFTPNGDTLEAPLPTKAN
ncbi:CehA/McbA family metallohydrolase [Tautonia sp. JC769]|uniref:CehA/McbA family metallohydrolase n=1 Tax=Tautonia sp. JC769 TaxID=3232135 RepID=UPI0034599320